MKVNRQEKINLALSRKLLADLGLGDRTASSADRISLGQSKRVAIARAVQAGAKVLFLDEPLAGLDADGVNDIIDLLHGIARSENLTLVIVEHVMNIPRILDIATTVWTLREGKIIVESPKDVRPDYNSDSVAIESLKKICSTDAKKTETFTLPGGAVLNIFGDKTGDQPLLEVKELVVYRGKRLVIGETVKDNEIRGLSFRLYKGQLAILQAPNGWGKTTLFQAISGVIPVKKGEVFIKGKCLSNMPPWDRLREGLSFLQAQNNVFPNLTVSESLFLAGCENIFKDGLPADKKVSDLSGGQRQAVALNCAAAHSKELVALMDEPFSNFDQTNSTILVNWIKKTIDNGICFIALPYLL
jgi:branched-chain amino acid transport system ATP-binding protein